MAVVNPIFFQVVGFQNSGKTTFIKKLIIELKKKEFTSVTIKHHGHGGKPSIDGNKDSSQHIEAGAYVSLVEGDGRLILQAEKNEWSLEEKLKLMTFFQPDIILIEGHKHEDFPKAIIIRKKEDTEQLLKLKNVKVAYYWDSTLISENSNNIPYFNINDPKGLEWLVQLLISEKR